MPTPGFDRLEEPVADAWTDFHAETLKEIQDPEADPFVSHLTNQCFWIVATALFKNRVLKVLPHTEDITKSDLQVTAGGALAYLNQNGRPRIEMFHHREFEILKRLKTTRQASDYLSLTPIEEKIYRVMPPALPGNQTVTEFGTQVPRSSIGLRLFTREQMLEDLGRPHIKTPPRSYEQEVVLPEPASAPVLSVLPGGLHADAA